MNCKIKPSTCSGTITIPSSKSLTHRAIICASLSKGISIIKNVNLSNDVLDTISCMINLGSKIHIRDNVIQVEGIKEFNARNTNLNIFESASTLRMIIPLLSLFKSEFKITCSEGLIKRPLSIYEELYKENNLLFNIDNNTITINGSLDLVNYNINGNISSQFISGLLFYLPLLDHDSIIKVNNLESTGYVLMTIDMLKKFNINIINDNNNEFIIKGNQEYKSASLTIDGDYTQLATFQVLSCINNDISVSGFNKTFYQNDQRLLDLINNYEFINNTYFFHKVDDISFHEFDLKDNIDLAPIMAILFSKFGGKLYNIKRLRIKESDRLNAIIYNLDTFGIKYRLEEDVLTINKTNEFYPHRVCKTFNDHRIFMAFSILATICKEEVEFDNYECSNKSYPLFLDDLFKLEIGVKYEC